MHSISLFLLLHLRIGSIVRWPSPWSRLVLLSSIRLLNSALRWLLSSINPVCWRCIAAVLGLVLATVDRDVQLVVDHVDGAVIAALRWRCTTCILSQVVGGVAETAPCSTCLLHPLLLEIVRRGYWRCGLPSVSLSFLSLLEDELPLGTSLGLGHFSDWITIQWWLLTLHDWITVVWWGYTSTATMVPMRSQVSNIDRLRQKSSILIISPIRLVQFWRRFEESLLHFRPPRHSRSAWHGHNLPHSLISSSLLRHNRWLCNNIVVLVILCLAAALPRIRLLRIKFILDTVAIGLLAFEVDHVSWSKVHVAEVASLLIYFYTATIVLLEWCWGVLRLYEWLGWNSLLNHPISGPTWHDYRRQLLLLLIVEVAPCKLRREHMLSCLLLLHYQVALLNALLIVLLSWEPWVDYWAFVASGLHLAWRCCVALVVLDQWSKVRCWNYFLWEY